MRIKFENPKDFDWVDWLDIIFIAPYALYACWYCNAEMTLKKLDNGEWHSDYRMLDKRN